MPPMKLLTRIARFYFQRTIQESNFLIEILERRRGKSALENLRLRGPRARERVESFFANATRGTVNLRAYENVCSRRLESIKSVDKVVRYRDIYESGGRVLYEYICECIWMGRPREWEAR